MCRGAIHCALDLGGNDKWPQEGVTIMVRQCAWCLRLMDSAGVHISSMPIPKIYAASHGMCQTCGALWLEDAIVNGDDRSSEFLRPESIPHDTSEGYRKGSQQQVSGSPFP